MSFETVSRGSVRKDRPGVSVYKSYHTRFNAAASREFLEDETAVTFLVDHEADRLGFQLGEGPESYKIQPRSGGAGVMTTAYLHEFGLDPQEFDESVFMPLEYDEEHDLLVADATPLRERGEKKRLRELPDAYGLNRTLGEVCDAVEQYDTNIKIKTRIGASDTQTVRRLLAELGLGPEGGDQPFEGEKLEERLAELREVVDE